MTRFLVSKTFGLRHTRRRPRPWRLISTHDHEHRETVGFDVAIMRKLEVCALTVVCLLSLTTAGATAANCDTKSDLGLTECVKLPDYTDYQWATCLTKDYIIRVSAAVGKLHRCKDFLRTQCYYQCMIEEHDTEAGQVYPDCSCSSGETPVKTDILSPDCVSPSGLNCSWYESCLEKRYSCSGTEYDYAIRYALKFCNLYSETYSQFVTLLEIGSMLLANVCRLS